MSLLSALYCGLIDDPKIQFKRVECRHTFEVVFPILKGRNSAFIAAIESGLFSKNKYR